MNNTAYPPFQIAKSRRFPFMYTLLATGVTVIVSVIIAILLNLFVFQSYYVDGESMSPTLHTDNRLVISKVERTVAALGANAYIPERGQIIIIDGAVSPRTETNAPELIKRVIGIPGDTVRIQNGVVSVTNATQGEFNVDTSLGLSLAPTYTSKPLEVYVPDGCVFVLGDNRSEGASLDSRVFGVVKSDYIHGRLWARIMPINEGRVF